MVLDGFIFPLVLLPLLFVVVPAVLLLIKYNYSSTLLLLVYVLSGLAIFLTAIWYFAKLEASPKMGTYGKRIMGIQTTDLNGQRITLMTAIVRMIVKNALSGFLMIGYLMAAFTAKKQALHDILAGTIVTKRRP